jgi:FKBP-type peptidyl-prolyl cis-trans isomerase FkpA
MRTVLRLLPSILLAACFTTPDRCPVNPSDPTHETFAPALGVDLATMERTELGDYRKDLVVGTGAALTTLANVQIHYSAYLANGTLIDQVIDQPFPLDLGTRATIGLADGMLGMFVGGQRLIVVPSQLGLGACDNGPVPGNSTIVYKVELLAIN